MVTRFFEAVPRHPCQCGDFYLRCRPETRPDSLRGRDRYPGQCGGVSLYFVRFRRGMSRKLWCEIFWGRARHPRSYAAFCVSPNLLGGRLAPMGNVVLGHPPDADPAASGAGFSVRPEHRFQSARGDNELTTDRRLRAWPREHRRRRCGAMDFAGGDRVAVDRCGAATAGLSARRRMRRAARRVRAMWLTPSRGHGGFGDHSAWRALSYAVGQRG
jgi:hypothetical protein